MTAELSQEVAYRLVHAGPRLDPGRNPRGYLFRTAANVWRDHVRRDIVQRRAEQQLQHGETAAAPAADKRVLERDLRGAIRRAIAELPAAQREVIELRHYEELTFRRISERLGRPLGTVLAQMRAALVKIATALESYR